MKRNSVVVALSLVLFACGQPEDSAAVEGVPTPEQAMLASTDPDTIRTMPTPEQVAAEMKGVDSGGQAYTSEEVEALAICPLEHVDPCPAIGYGTCAVRCCDGYLKKSFQVCGNCGAWATGICASHDTRKVIRWE
ncbi:hypothetical protein [Myxococcus landrumensis]|uniref:Lipoprotein n=1 Tax=Myxococcus landrumensis TaxID=2813577 RepID=A0ABX7NA70_9BACT|nr:hypothetical protein [Myxococcus landrumus]QSQ14530.1 hypothetical protein JY572_00060 [Myxococcus landrumus]